MSPRLLWSPLFRAACAISSPSPVPPLLLSPAPPPWVSWSPPECATFPTHQLTPGAGGGSPPHGGHSSWAHLRNAVRKRRLGRAGPGEGRGDQGLRPTIFAPACPAGYSPWRLERSAGPPLRSISRWSGSFTSGARPSLASPAPRSPPRRAAPRLRPARASLLPQLPGTGSLSALAAAAATRPDPTLLLAGDSRAERGSLLPLEMNACLPGCVWNVYWPCSHSRAIPSFPSQLEWKIGLAWANTRGILNSPS